ncbi:hypothetical protein CYMTET_43552 [Cymbomonas tetramitiformis]|uniref:Uncharacterized protein n=1 Tax=Cymbomonas tetramitiformis TaxID=36881 RepID=A0AAE0F0F9_9CHLO|nr:hypothetical protein CYMTET_43552 [Cymbomonas tetramitiformis]
MDIPPFLTTLFYGILSLLLLTGLLRNMVLPTGPINWQEERDAQQAQQLSELTNIPPSLAMQILECAQFDIGRAVDMYFSGSWKRSLSSCLSFASSSQPVSTFGEPLLAVIGEGKAQSGNFSVFDCKYDRVSVGESFDPKKHVVIPTTYRMERSMTWRGEPVLLVGRVEVTQAQNVRTYSVEVFAPDTLLSNLPLDPNRPEFHPCSYKSQIHPGTYKSARFSSDSATAVWKQALRLIRENRNVSVSGPEKYGWKNPRVQALLIPAEPTHNVDVSELSTLFEIEEGRLPNTNFVTNVTNMGSRRQYDVNRTFMAFLQPVLKTVHPKDPEGASA